MKAKHPETVSTTYSFRFPGQRGPAIEVVDLPTALQFPKYVAKQKGASSLRSLNKLASLVCFITIDASTANAVTLLARYDLNLKI